ncbi:MAG TPA: cell envelope integrity protein CreD [Ohtaekwangia sp.]|uniref:cell envelope integrity protein CreD n=1 Tax=Ohtaekwangia sp. TaxID=2066019 RepID=UPI002F948D45
MQPSSSPAPLGQVFERISAWFRDSIVIKLFAIGLLILILLIPQVWLESIMHERQYRASSVVDEITSKWSGAQTLAGPVLVIPFTNREKIDKGKDGIEIREWTQDAYFLPEQLTIDGTVNPEIRHRGLFDAAVYKSTMQLQTTFQRPNFKKLNIDEKDVHWNEAHLVLCISDLRGISENPSFKLDTISLPSEPSNQIGFGVRTPPHTAASSYDDNYSITSTASTTSKTGIIATLPWQTAADFTGKISTQISLKGSTSLNFIPTGKTTEVVLQGPWSSPSFNGEFLPVSNSIDEKGFTANWKVLHYNRPFAQEWTGTEQEFSGSAFGAELLIPVDQYQKSIRTAKYGVLIILLTFISLFLVEIIKKIRIHAFQYLLIGVALIIYYTLLLSLSEHIGYNLAYLAASTATVVLISLYSLSFLKRTSLVMFFGAILSFFYGFIFVIIQMQDYSLLIGSIGLFMVIALVMYFSRNIKWYKEAEVVAES